MSFGRVALVLLAFGITIIFDGFPQVESYKILCPFPTISRSHFIVVEALMKGLALAGHNVTVASGFPPTKEIPNYRFVKNEMSDSAILDTFMEKPGDIMNMFLVIPAVLDFVEGETRNLLHNPEFQQIMKNEQFDLIVYEASLGVSLLGLSAHFKCPSVIFSSLSASSTQLRMMGNPLGASYVSNPVLAIPEPMDFWGRLTNFVFLIFEWPILYYWDKRTESTYNVHFRQPNFPTFGEMRSNISAIFVNDHMSQGGVRPLVPGIIEIGGIQVNDELAEMDDDLSKWMDASENGVVYCNFGSNLKINQLDPQLQKEIFHVFASLKENVLMKYEGNVADLPKNIRLGKWLPQVGILQHKNCKLFITHAGLGGVTEARYFGVPLITVPTFADQMSNSKTVVQKGWAIEIKFNELNAATLSAALNTILSNQQYTNRAKYISTLYRDRPQTALETAIFWIEYIIRHRGAAHIHSNAVNLNFFQYHSMDIIGFLFVALTLITVINIKILKCVWRMCCGRSKLKHE